MLGTISIHAPREGCDARQRTQSAKSIISIHAPREGCDGMVRHLPPTEVISIHAPREGCDGMVRHLPPTEVISIHAPREGCDVGSRLDKTNPPEFQSTHPVRGATRFAYWSSLLFFYFNPRTP